MSNNRIPGPVCQSSQERYLLYGVLTPTLTWPPGTVCVYLGPYSELVPKSPASSAQSLSFLFVSCLNPKQGLSDKDYQQAADTLQVEVAAIKAVAEVETSGAAFDSNGRPRILYERHYFHRLTNGKYSKDHPDISNSVPGGYGRFSEQYSKLERAYSLDADAALKSASWGRYQIMGANYQAAGYTSAVDFVRAMTDGEAEHLKAFTAFVNNNTALVKALQNKSWADFAAGYNGRNFKDNQYDTKMEAAYKRLSASSATSTTGRKP